jgi:hypothetical protein
MSSLDRLSPLSAAGSQPVQQPASSNIAPAEAAFAKALAAAQIGAADAPDGSIPHPMHTATKVVVHAKLQQVLAKAMADIAEARKEASAPDEISG